MKKYRTRTALLTLSFLLFLSILTACAGLSDTETKLSGDYELWRMSSYGKKIVLRHNEYTASQAIPAHVNLVAFDSDYIFAQQVYQNQQNSTTPNGGTDLDYYTIVVATNEVIGPMTEAEFDAWYAALGREEPPQWISTDDHSALVDRREALHPGQAYE